MAGKFGAVVVGGGPAGICAVGNLLAQRVSRISWVDPQFNGGRIDQSYREVPSNTKVSLFVQFAEAIEPFRKIIEDTPEPNAVGRLKQMNQDQGCYIAAAADMCKMLTAGLVRDDRVMQTTGIVKIGRFADSNWNVTVKPSEKEQANHHSSDLLVLCNGAHPTKISFPEYRKSAIYMDLDDVLKPSSLKLVIQPSDRSTFAVVGTSHSAVLALHNLYNLATTTHPNIRIKWFARSPLLYAEQMDGWILRDNTGLKGDAATWAKEYLEDDKFEKNHVGDYIEKIKIPQGQSFVESRRLSECSHVIQAIGYSHNHTPKIYLGDRKVKLKFDPYSGSFSDINDAKAKLPGLHGAGIAWPERVTDPYGNVEDAVGLFKFMKFLGRVVPEWMSARGM